MIELPKNKFTEKVMKFKEGYSSFLESSLSVKLQLILKWGLLVLLIVYSVLYLSEVGGLFHSLETNTENYNEDSEKFVKVSDFSLDDKGNIVLGYHADKYESTSIPVDNLIYLTRGALSGDAYFYPEVSIMAVEFTYTSMFEFMFKKHIISLFVLFLILTSVFTYSEKVQQKFTIFGTKGTRRLFVAMTLLLYIDITLSLIIV